MLFHGCSLPFNFQEHCSLFPERLLFLPKNSAKYFRLCQSQKDNPFSEDDGEIILLYPVKGN